MKALLSIVLLLAFGAYVYSENTPEQIAEAKVIELPKLGHMLR